LGAKWRREMTDTESVAARVIIADDHPLFRSALVNLVSRIADLEVVAEANYGQEAVDLSRRLRPELVLMDLKMPNVDGLQAIRTIKRELPRTVVLVLTVYEDYRYLAEALKAGASGYLLKTASPQQIIDTVCGALDGEFPLDQELATELLLRLTKEKREGQEPSSPGPGAPPHQRPMPSLPRELTPREVEVLRLLALGRTNQQIAKELLISTSTVKSHIQRILPKLGASDRTQAAVIACEMGLVSSL